MIDKQKQRNQVKSRFYYIFWGTATFAVVAGQVYVGTGYRLMSGAFHRIMDACLLYTSPSPRDATLSRMPSSA